jgi:small conductance mechanosensitive channel
MPPDINTNEIFRSLDEINFVNILLIIVAAWLLVLIVQRVIPWLAERLPSRMRLYVLPIAPFLRLLVIVVAIARLVPEVINPSLQNIWAILAAVSVAIGFAFKDYVSSILAGIVVLVERPYRAGDWVEVDGDYGEISVMGLRAFQMITPDDSTITVPHNKIWTENISSANSGQQQHMCVAHFYLAPQHDAERARAALHDVALTSVYLDPRKSISVMISECPGATHYQLKAYPVDGRYEFQFISDLTVRGKNALARLSIEPALMPFYHDDRATV